MKHWNKLWIEKQQKKLLTVPHTGLEELMLLRWSLCGKCCSRHCQKEHHSSHSWPGKQKKELQTQIACKYIKHTQH